MNAFFYARRFAALTEHPSYKACGRAFVLDHPGSCFPFLMCSQDSHKHARSRPRCNKLLFILSHVMRCSVLNTHKNGRQCFKHWWMKTSRNQCLGFSMAKHHKLCEAQRSSGLLTSPRTLHVQCFMPTTIYVGWGGDPESKSKNKLFWVVIPEILHPSICQTLYNTQSSL